MIAKYVLLIGLFHRVYSIFNSFGTMRTNLVPYESTPQKIDVLQTQGSSIGDLFGVTSKLKPSYARLIKSLPSNKQLIKSQVSNQQLNNPQWSYSQLSNPQGSYLQLSNLQRSYSQLNNAQQSNLQLRKPQPNVKWNNETVDNKNVKIESFGHNNNNIFNDHKISQQQAQLQQEKLKQRLKLEAAERLKQQQTMERLQQQTVERLRQQAVEKLKQQTINNLKQKQAHLFNLLEGVTKKRQENQKSNLEVWQRIAKQRDKRIQRRFYEHALHDNDDDDDDDDDND